MAAQSPRWRDPLLCQWVGRTGRSFAKGMDPGGAGDGKREAGWDWTDDASTPVVVGLMNLVRPGPCLLQGLCDCAGLGTRKEAGHVT